MQPVKYLCCLVILFASCRSVRQTAALPADVNQPPIAYAVSPRAMASETMEPEPSTEVPGHLFNKEEKIPEIATAESALPLAKTSIRKVQSFAQLKEMAAAGKLQMNKKDVKMLNKLEKKYKGNFEQFRADTFEFTTKAKIVAGVGLIGLFLAIFAGSWFGFFLFLLAALGFILRFIGVIEF